MFAKRVLDSAQHTDHMDAGESHYSQVFWSCNPPPLQPFFVNPNLASVHMVCNAWQFAN
jgi:hypothetical protein